MKARPSKVDRVIKVDLGYPRVRTQDVFVNYRKQILEILDFAGQVQEPEYYL